VGPGTDHAHVQGAGEPGDRSARAAESDDGDGLSGDACNPFELPAVLHLAPYEVRQTNAEGEHATDHVLGHHAAGDPRCVSDGQAIGIPGEQMVHAGAAVTNPLDGGAGHDRVPGIRLVLELDAEKDLGGKIRQGAGEFPIAATAA
jgi:hypothetical protein